MHDFDSRMEQLLAALGHLAPGHRERLVRPVRQHDLVCWPDGADAEHAPTMKAAMRVAVHELLDQFCFQLESALTRCASEPARVLMLATTTLAMAGGMSVEFIDDNVASGVSCPGKSRLSIEVLPEDRLRFSYRTTSSGDTAVATCEVCVNEALIREDPFVEAEKVIRQLRQ